MNLIKNRIIFKRIFLGVFSLGLCFCFEIIARLILPENKLNLIESIQIVCHEDNQFLWKQKKDLNVIFQGKDVHTNDLGLRNDKIIQGKRDKLNRVICLGGSSTFGWGVEVKDAYPMRLQRLINEQASATIVEVINAGQIGYTSYQGKLFFKKYLLRYRPDIVTVSYGLNDIDKVRFFRNKKLSDKQIKFADLKIIRLKNYIVDKRIYFLAKRLSLWLIRRSSKLSAVAYKNQYENSKIRVSASEYKDNLNDIISICKSNNIKVVFIIMPINLDLPDIDNKGDGRQLSNYYYQEAIKYEQVRDHKNAALFFKKALEYQVFICKINGYLYQKIMIKVAKENKIPFVNAAELFKSEHYRRWDLFNGSKDMIHPNDKGHEIIAQAVYKCIIDNAMLTPYEEIIGK